MAAPSSPKVAAKPQLSVNVSQLSAPPISLTPVDTASQNASSSPSGAHAVSPVGRRLWGTAASKLLPGKRESPGVSPRSPRGSVSGGPGWDGLSKVIMRGLGRTLEDRLKKAQEDAQALLGPIRARLRGDNQNDASDQSQNSMPVNVQGDRETAVKYMYNKGVEELIMSKRAPSNPSVLTACLNTVWCGDKKDGAIQIRDARTCEDLIRIPGSIANQGVVRCMLVVNEVMWVGYSKGALVQYSIRDACARIRDATAANPHQGGIRCMIFHAHFVFTGAEDFVIWMWDVQRFGPKKQFSGHSNHVLSLIGWDFYLISGSGDHTIKVWDLEDNTRALATYTEHSGDTLCFAMSRTELWCGSADTRISIWGLDKRGARQGQPLRFQRFLCGHRDRVNSLVRCGTKMLSGSGDFSIIVWDTRNFEQRNRFDAHTKYIHNIVKVCKAERARFWSCGNEGQIHVWHSEGFFEYIGGVETGRNKALGGALETIQDFDANIHKYGEEKSRLEHDLEVLQEELDRLKQQLALANSRIADLQEEKEKLERQRDELRDILSNSGKAELENKILQLQLDKEMNDRLNNELRKMLADMKALLDEKEKRLKEMENEIFRLRAARDDTKVSLDDASRKLRDSEETARQLHDKFMKLTDEMDALKRRLEEKDAGLRGMLDQNRDLQKQLDELRRKYNEDLEKERAKNAHQHDELARLRAENDALKRRLAETEHNLSLRTRELEDARNENVALSAELHAAHGRDERKGVKREGDKVRIKSLSKQVEDWRKKCDQMQKELEDALARLEEMTRKFNKAKHSNNEHKTKGAQQATRVQQLEKALEDARRRAQDLMSELEQSQQETADLRKQMQSLVSAHQKEIDRLQALLDKAQKDLEGLQKDSRSWTSDREALLKQLADLQKLLAEAEAMRDNILNQFDEFDFVLQSRGDFISAVFETFDMSIENRKLLQDLMTVEVIKKLPYGPKQEISMLLFKAHEAINATRVKLRTIMADFLTDVEKLHLGLSPQLYVSSRSANYTAGWGSGARSLGVAKTTSTDTPAPTRAARFRNTGVTPISVSQRTISTQESRPKSVHSPTVSSPLGGRLGSEARMSNRRL